LTLKLFQAGKMSVCVMGIDFAFFYHFSVGFWSCSDNVVFFGFHFIVKNEQNKQNIHTNASKCTN
jgi:hypothetical protein